MKTFNREVGRIGETVAAEYLIQKSYEIIECNYSTRFGEIDLVVRDKDILIFVEVKTKKGLGFGTPEEMLTSGKYQRVKRMATVYLNGRDVPCRIDMIAVVLDVNNQAVSLKHYPNVNML